MIFITTELLGQAADWIQLEFGRRPKLRRVRVNDEWQTEIVEDDFTMDEIATIRGLLIIFLRRIFVDTNTNVSPR